MRRANCVSPLAIVLPHPNIPRRRSSLLSAGSASPHTPRSCCGSPTFASIYLNPAHRKSTDSWNSSNLDFTDDLDSEWKPEHTLLLQRTLDALPAHLLTPFNGPIPPSNILDKIARGVAQAKGPSNWPHSLRATRVKLIEICRSRAEDDSLLAQQIKATSEAGETSERRSRKPLYRQSSMDFLSSTPTAKDNLNIGRLSERLQQVDKTISSPYHPYARTTRSRAHQTQASNGKSPSSVAPSLLNPSTPSSSTLTSISSLSVGGANPRFLRRSPSALSSLTSADSFMSSDRGGDICVDEPSLFPSHLADPRVQRVRRSESFRGSSSTEAQSKPASVTATPPPRRQSVKRAPSYGALAQEAKARGHVSSNSSHADPSSDEEEKDRTRSAKRARMKNATPPPSSAASSPVSSAKSPRGVNGPSKTTRPPTHGAKTGSKGSEPSPGQRVRRMNLQRNPSIFGPELAHLHIPAPEPMSITPIPSPKGRDRPLPPLPVEEPMPRTLRRVKRLAPGRKISFGSLIPSGEDADIEPDADEAEGRLGSAFQLQ